MSARLRVEVYPPSAESSTRYVKALDAWLDRQASVLAPGTRVTIHKGTGGTWQYALAAGELWQFERETFGPGMPTTTTMKGVRK